MRRVLGLLMATVLAAGFTTAINTPTATAADAGTLDPSFGTNGQVTTDLGSPSTRLWAMAIQADDKIVAAGSAAGDFTLVRYMPNGALDRTFGAKGHVSTSIGKRAVAYGVAIQSDGKIVLAGYAHNELGYCCETALARYMPNGDLDTTFGAGGIALFDYPGGTAFDVVVQPDQKIVAVGRISDQGFMAIRLDTDGTPDTSFGTNGRVITPFGGMQDTAYAATIQSDGRILAAGAGGEQGDVAVVRYNVDGSLDAGFGSGGAVTTDISGYDSARDVAIQDDGKIIVAAIPSSGNFALVRYNSDGSLDSSFDGDGLVVTDFGGDDRSYSVAIQADGKIVEAGFSHQNYENDFAVARYNENGTLDTAFGTAGTTTTGFGDRSNDIAQAVSLQSDGKIIAAGGAGATNPPSVFAVARYLAATPMEVTTSTTLTKDLVGNIVVAASNVTLDCAGHSVTGPGSGIGILVDNLEGVTVKNCHVSGFDLGIFYRNSTAGTITGNTSFDNANQGIALNTTSNTSVADNTVYNNVTAGIGLAHADFGNVVMNNNAHDNPRAGIDLFFSDHNTVTGNTAAANGQDGILLNQTTSNIVTDNHSSDNPGNGITALTSNNGLVQGNTTADNGNHGIQIADSWEMTVTENAASGNSHFGIVSWGSTHTVYADNEAAENRDDGLHLGEKSDWNTVENNRTHDNYSTGIGLYRADENILRNNESLTNGTNGLWVGESFGNEILNNDSRSNANNGYEIWASGSESTPNVFDGNRSQSNGRYGMVVSDSDYTTVSNGHFVQNGADGIAVWAESNGNAIVDNQVVNNTWTGILIVGGSEHNTVMRNVTASNGETGIAVIEANDNSVVGNTASDNENSGFAVINSARSMFVDNEASGQDNDGTDGNYGSGFTISHATETTFEGNTAVGNYHGFRLDFSDENTFTGNSAERNVVGFDIVASDSNAFTGNEASHNGGRSGFELRDGSSENSLTRNTASNNGKSAGFSVNYGFDNLFTENTALHNKVGFGVWEPSTGNTFDSNYGRNAWFDQIDATPDGSNDWIDNDFKWIQ